MKLSLAVAALTVASSAAFVPQQNVRPSTSLADDLFDEKEPAATPSKTMSKALPFVAAPKILDGSLPGDVGFDPFGFAGSDKATLYNMREAEIKHGRLAMLAVVGWPLAELFDRSIADATGLPTALTKSGASPSVLNGGLEKIDPAYWVAILALAGVVELERVKVMEEKGKDYELGDVGFDPLGLMPKTAEGQFNMRTKEIKNGRLAMLAILGFVVQEALYRIPVVAETPVFFKPLF